MNCSRPHAAGLGHAITLGTSARCARILDAYTRQGVAIFASVDASTRLRVGHSYGVRLSADEYDDITGDVRNAIVLSALRRSAARHHGILARPTRRLDPQFRVEPSVSTGDETLGFVRATADGRIYETFGAEDRLTFAARLARGLARGGLRQCGRRAARSALLCRRRRLGARLRIQFHISARARRARPDRQAARACSKARSRRVGALAIAGVRRRSSTAATPSTIGATLPTCVGAWASACATISASPRCASISPSRSIARKADDDFALYISLGQAF